MAGEKRLRKMICSDVPREEGDVLSGITWMPGPPRSSGQCPGALYWTLSENDPLSFRTDGTAARRASDPPRPVPPGGEHVKGWGTRLVKPPSKVFASRRVTT